jgi:hypothetical protein
MRNPCKISRVGVERLIQEIFRQAVYDWEKPECQSEIKEFFRSPWANDLAETFNLTPETALERLEKGAISPKAFHAEYRSSLSVVGTCDYPPKATAGTRCLWIDENREFHYAISEL